MATNILTEFDRNIFESIVDKIIVGRINENNEKEPNVIRFILKTREEYDKIYHYDKEKLRRQKPTKEMVQNGMENMV